MEFRCVLFRSGKTDVFGGAATITEALGHILADQTARDSIVAVRLSVAEVGTNSNGIAVITYERNDTRHELTFVRDEAVSLLQPGARYDTALRNAPVSRELLFNRRRSEERGVGKVCVSTCRYGGSP